MNFRLVIFKKRFPAIYQGIVFKTLYINILQTISRSLFIKNISRLLITISS